MADSAAVLADRAVRAARTADRTVSAAETAEVDKADCHEIAIRFHCNKMDHQEQRN